MNLYGNQIYPLGSERLSLRIEKMKGTRYNLAGAEGLSSKLYHGLEKRVVIGPVSSFTELLVPRCFSQENA